MVNKYKKPEGQKLIYDSYDRLLAAWGVPVEERDIPTTYGTTHVIIAGDASSPPLLLFHGVGDDSALMWLLNAAELSRSFRLYAFDTIGGPGKSVPNEAYFKGIDHKQWIGELLDGLKLENAYAAGVSMGTYFACMAAAAHPDRVKKIVCMAGGISSSIAWMFAFLPEALLPTEKNTIKLIKKMVFNADAFLGDHELMMHWKLLLRYFNNQSIAFHKIKPYTAQTIAALTDKALFLIGDHDIIAYSAQKEKALRDNNMKYRIIKDAGHGLNHEQAELVNREIKAFLLG